MPYVPTAVQQKHKELVDALYKADIGTPGELNYLLTKLVDNYLGPKSERNYAIYNAAIGALECAKLELYRRVVSVYEDQKKHLNGDVY